MELERPKPKSKSSGKSQVIKHCCFDSDSQSVLCCFRKGDVLVHDKATFKHTFFCFAVSALESHAFCHMLETRTQAALSA